MATRLHRLKGDQFFSDTGTLLNGGKLYFYEATTTNLQTTFSDAAGTVPNTNPLTLDAFGRLTTSIYFGDSDTYDDYKETLTNAAGVTITNWPIDNIPAAEPTATASAFAPPLLAWVQVTNVASPVTLLAANAGNAYEGDTTSGSINFNLPSAASVGNGKPFAFKKTASANSMIITPFGAETIDNVAGALTITRDEQTVVLFSNGAEWYGVMEYGRLITLPTVQRFTSGSGTYTPAAGVRFIRVRMVGGGGGGGAQATNNGAAGTASVFGSWTANFGAGGVAGATGTGGAGGAGGADGTGTRSARFDGQNGGAFYSTNGGFLGGGHGASSAFGGGVFGIGAAGNAAKANTGSGGAGAGSAAAAGGGGGAGEYVEFFVSAPGATSYTVGAAGAGGAAGTTAGGSGAAGIIIVEEFY